MKLNLRSIGVKLWIYFALFAGIVLTILWLLQLFSLNSFYEGMKINDISRTANFIIENYREDDFESVINEIAYNRALLIFVTDLKGDILYTAHYAFRNPMDVFPHSSAGNGDSPSSLPGDYDDFLNRLKQSETGQISYRVNPDKVAGTILVYGRILPDAVLYISAPLNPMDSTTDILGTQLIYVIFIALLLSVFIAFFISKKLSRPIMRMTNTAKGLAEGNYDIYFPKGDYTEIDELSATLNYVTSELSKVERLRRELIANITHDFRTPLTMIQAYAEMIKDISGENKAKREYHVEVIIEETERLSVLVDDMLELSLLQSGNERLTLFPVNTSELLGNTLKRFTALAERKSLCFEPHIPPELYTVADAVRLERVFYNLIGNAIKHSEEGGKITVRLSPNGKQLRFEVTDDGGGIPADELPLIWERYHKSEAGGDINAGLGLAIVKELLELHDAEYGVESELGIGSTFWFVITEKKGYS